MVCDEYNLKSRDWVFNRNLLNCIHLEPEKHQTMSDCPPGSDCSKPDKANPGLVEILILIYLLLKADFSQD